jgi:hypothetical protein
MNDVLPRCSVSICKTYLRITAGDTDGKLTGAPLISSKIFLKKNRNVPNQIIKGPRREDS